MKRRELKPGTLFKYNTGDTALYWNRGPGACPTGFIESRPGLGFDDEDVTILVKNAAGGWEPSVCPDKTDPVNSPPHYARLSPQPIEIMAAWNLPCFPSMAIKYIARAGFKAGVDTITDYRKGISYLEREIARLQGKSVVKDVPNT